jgi:phage tail-like protein
MATLYDRLPGTLALPEDEPYHRRSWLLNFLPSMYAGDDFLNRFLLIFEDTLSPLLQMADNIHYYFNPLMTSPELLEWLATWVNLVLDESWSLEQRRHLIQSATELYSWRGTKRGLSQFIKLYIGVDPEITEYVDGMVLGEETLLGVNTTIAGRERHSFTVTLRLNGLSKSELEYKEAAIRRIIQAEKPAHTAYRLVILTNGTNKPSLTQGEY